MEHQFQTSPVKTLKLGQKFNPKQYEPIGLIIEGRSYIETSVLEQYCFCDLIKRAPPTKSCLPILPGSRQNSRLPGRQRTVLDRSNLSEQVENLIGLLNNFPDDYGLPIFTPKQKNNNRSRRSHRRSQYIGVFKNGPNWQALVTIRKRKIYIGTYPSETQAAKAFDFYSILNSGLLAVTNFEYRKEDLQDMVSNFMNNDGKFIP